MVKNQLVGRPGLEHGFTLIELVVIIIVLSIIAAVGLPKMGFMVQSSKVNATKGEMAELKRAIVGDSQSAASGGPVHGFEADVGFAPSLLRDLVSKPDTVADWDRILSIGWNGPYIDSTDGGYLRDAWGQPYVYEPAARTLTSVGSGSNITISF